MHYPLLPHSRTTVKKLAVSPQWTNYGLRIFGYLHPYTDGYFVFALSSDDNSEFWLSTNDSPLNLQLLTWVGKSGREWTAPGEFDKYASQISGAVWLSAQRKYFFELIHKQNDAGTDHVEVAWKIMDQRFRFTVIESSYISLYVDESTLSLSDVAHIPQTIASHQRTSTKQHDATADMLREDPRDTFYQVPLANSKFLQGVLPDCSYKPSYTIKDFPLGRYQGLQFVHMSYIYPNDYTRLTHMETQTSCFYPESPYYMKMFGFSRYMKLDRPDTQDKDNLVKEFGLQRRDSVKDQEAEYYQREKEIRPQQKDNDLFPDYGDDYDDYFQKRKRKLFSFVTKESDNTQKNKSNTSLFMNKMRSRQEKVTQLQSESQKAVNPLHSMPTQAANRLQLQQNQTELHQEGHVKKREQIKRKARFKPARRQKLKSVKPTVRPGLKNSPMPVDREHVKAKARTVIPPEKPVSKQHKIQRSPKMNQTQIQKLKDSKPQFIEKNPRPERLTVTKRQGVENEMDLKTDRPVVSLSQRDTFVRKHLRDKEIEMNMPLQLDLDNNIHRAKKVVGGKTDKNQPDVIKEEEEEDQAGEEDRGFRGRGPRKGGRDSPWGPRDDFEGMDDEDLTPKPIFDPVVNWSQTFQVQALDLQAQRLDWIDLRCNITGNLLLDSSDALTVVQAFMDQLNEKHHGQFTLVRVVNVVKRVDWVQGNRYLLELELKDASGQMLRLSHYIYTLIRSSRQRSKDFGLQQSKPQLVLCNPVGFRWNPLATVHFIVPVKNQARWVQQLIADMEQLFRDTGDTNFNLIITDYNSTDMDVRKALQKSSLPRYQYVKLSGNFERSAGLQAGIDLINDNHSIVFLCDLHIHFPPSIIDTIRKHCVEGYMAFAPIVMRLDCGATPLDARGYWEVNGFGLLGIYKSDLDAVGGMNTREFTDSWGGEDWELLDRILQGGLEVDRIYLRNFFHHYHSKRGMWNRRLSPKHR
ncbi:uncharacterized protein V6R79_002181 [Siganus canaliculatus]